MLMESGFNLKLIRTLISKVKKSNQIMAMLMLFKDALHSIRFCSNERYLGNNVDLRLDVCNVLRLYIRRRGKILKTMLLFFVT